MYPRDINDSEDTESLMTRHLNMPPVEKDIGELVTHISLIRLYQTKDLKSGG